MPIKNMGSSTVRFKEGLIATGSVHNPDGSESSHTLVVSGSALFTGEVVVNGELKDGDGGIYEIGGPGSGGGSLEYATGHVDLTTNNKPVNWVNASSISASSGIKSWFIVPKSTTIDKVIVSVKSNNFSTANDGDITLSIYKNQPNYNSTVVNQTVGADTFSEKVSNMGTGNPPTTDCNQKIFDGLNLSVAEGDLIHIKVGKSLGSDKEALVTVVFNSTTGTSAVNKSAFMARAQSLPGTASNATDPWVFSFGDGMGNSATNSDAYNRDTILVAPHDGIIKDLILTVHQASFTTSTYGDITLKVYRNPVLFDSEAELIDITTAADNFTGKNRRINNVFTVYAQQMNFADLLGGNTYSVSKGDIIQVTISGSTSVSYSNLDITLSLVIEDTT